MDWLKLLISAFKRIAAAITGPFRPLLAQIRQLFNINLIVTKLIQPVTKKVQDMMKLRPDSREDYYVIGKFWIYRKLFYFITLALCAGVLLYFTMFAPAVEVVSAEMSGLESAAPASASFDYNDPKIQSFSGIANIRAADGKIVYTGEVQEGVCNGMGTLCSRDGVLLYEGVFENNKYNGPGTLYHPNGKVSYEGEFKDNLYNGAGIMYSLTGHLVYDGTFKNGVYEGDGKEFSGDADKALLYEGGFAEGKRHGLGNLYNPDGSAYYQGEFFQGKMQGAGTLFGRSGKPLYTGRMYADRIDYKSLLGSTLEDMEAAFPETPKLYYSDDTCCFVFEQAGIILSAACALRTDTRLLSPTDFGNSGRSYFPPGEFSIVGTESELEASGTLPEWTVQTSGKAFGNVIPMSWSIDGAASSSQEQNLPPGSSSTPESAPLETLLDKVIENSSAQDEELKALLKELLDATSKPENPEFVTKEITLYFEVDSDIWQAEDELDKSKIIIDQVTIFKDLNFPIPEAAVRMPDSPPPAEEDCIAVDYVRSSLPESFSNVIFQMNKYNRFHVSIDSINGTSRIDRLEWIDPDGVIYRFCYDMSDLSNMKYFTVQMQGGR